MAATITYEEWIAELSALGHADGALTVQEIMETTGRNRNVVQRYIRDGIRAGRVRRAQKRIEDIAGRLTWVPAYVLLSRRQKPQASSPGVGRTRIQQPTLPE